jgi:hypothetical protein
MLSIPNPRQYRDRRDRNARFRRRRIRNRGARLTAPLSHQEFISPSAPTRSRQDVLTTPSNPLGGNAFRKTRFYHTYTTWAIYL